MERAEATGFGVAAAGHVALFAALSLGFASTQLPVPKSDPIEVAFVDEVGLESQAPVVSTETPAPALGQPDAPLTPAPVPEPLPAPPQPVIQPRAAPPPPAPSPRPAPPQPKAKAQPAPKAAPPKAKAQPKQASGGRLDGILAGLNPNASKGKATTPRAATVGAEARASIDAAILRALTPCQRQSLPVPEARNIKVQVEVTLSRTGALASARVLKVTNDDPDLRIYEQRMKDLALSVVQQCSPIRGLPEQYYDVPRGWKQFRYTFPRT